MDKLDRLLESYLDIQEVSPEWLGKKIGGAFFKIKKAGAAPGMAAKRMKYNKVFGKVINYNKKKYTGGMRDLMSKRFDKARHGNISAMPAGFHPSGWKDALYK